MSTPNSEFPNRDLIRQGINYRFKISCRAFSMEVRPLSVYEEDLVTDQVIDEFERVPLEKRTSLKQSILMSIKKLMMAQTSDVGANDAKVRELELQRLTPGELDMLFKQYISGCDKLNPVLERMDAAKLQEIVEDLKKNSNDREKILTECSFYQLVDISRHLLTREESPMVS